MRQNLIVILLPAAVMIGLFIFGFHVINQTSTITNEELINHIQMEIEVDSREGGSYSLHIEWHWTDFPSDGLVGDDMLEIIFLDHSMEALNNINLRGDLQLLQSNETIYETVDLLTTDEGFLFTFPNRVENQLLFGPKGSSELIFSTEESIAYIEVKYYHTWKEWDTFMGEREAVEEFFFNQGIGSYWVANRSISLR